MATFLRVDCAKFRPSPDARIIGLIENTTKVIVMVDKRGQQEDEEDEKRQSIVLARNERMIPAPFIKKDQVEHILVAGPSGCGKSTWVYSYACVYLHLFPEQRVHLISSVKTDAKLDLLEPKRWLIGGDNLAGAKPEDFQDSLVVFDDVENILDSDAKKVISNLRDGLLEYGRHHGTYVISVLHNPRNNHSTKTSLNEASQYVLFPGGGGDFQMEHLLKTYCGITGQKQLKALLSPVVRSHSRWFAFQKRAPVFITHEHGAFNLNTCKRK